MGTVAKLRKEFVRSNYLAYYYQKHNYHASERTAGFEDLLPSFMRACDQMEEDMSQIILIVVYGFDIMRVATQLASLFTWFHERGFSSGGITPEGIMIDSIFSIKVFDFGFLAHVREEDNTVPTCYPVLPDVPDTRYSGIRTLKADVYVFGCLLLELLGNRLEEDYLAPHTWAVEQRKAGKKSIVKKSLLQDNDELAFSITNITLECLNPIEVLWSQAVRTGLHTGDDLFVRGG
ncbi:unnamed protein product [Cuscuta campestris]|uniref:Protein kinase domain-containing protein n=1 Tax=Cuscuta campestris TaxID=132261 RepID=A0A484LTE7_9ASTE|nr:unnamed protein product [Cuscuta campestris]